MPGIHFHKGWITTRIMETFTFGGLDFNVSIIIMFSMGVAYLYRGIIIYATEINQLK